MDPDQNAVLADENQIVGVIHDLDARHVAVRVVADAQAAALRDAVVVNAAAAALALLADGQHVRTRAADACTDDIVALAQLDDADAVAGTAHRAGAVLGKADGRAVVGGNNDFVVTLGQVAPHQTVALVQRNGDQAHLADVAELGQRRALDEALLRHHRGVGVVLVHAGLLLQHQRDLLALLQLQQVHNMAALGRAAALGHLIALQAVDAALVCHKQHIIMRRTDKKFLGEVVVLLGHALHAASAAVLCLVGVQRRALDVALVGQRKDAGLLGDQVLNIDLAGDGLDGGAALVAVLVGQRGQVGLDDALDVLVVGQNVLIIGDGLAQLAQLLLDFEDLQTGQTAQLQLDNGVRLQLVKAEVVHDGLPRLGKAALAGADRRDDLIDDVNGLVQALEDVLALLCLLQLKRGAAADDLHLELNIALHHGFQAHDLGHAVVQRQHDDADGVLQLGEAVELVQHDLGVRVLLDLNDDLHAGAARGLVVQVADALDALILDKVSDGLDQAGLVDHVGDFRNQDLVAPVLFLDDLGTAPQRDFAAARGVSSADAAAAHDDAARREVGALDVLHQPGQVDFGVVHQGDHAVDDLAQVVGRDVRRHADGDTLAAVDEQVRETAGQDMGLLLGLVKVGVPVDGVFFNVGQHLAGHLGHAGLGVTVSSRGVAVHGAEVALAVHKRVTQAEILRQTHHGIIDRGVAVRVVRAQHRTDGIGRFAVGVLRVVAALVHRVQDAAVDGLQAVAHIGQSARHDNRHRVVKERRLDLLLHIAHNDLRTGPRHHDDVFFHCITLTIYYVTKTLRFSVQHPLQRVVVDIFPCFFKIELVADDVVVVIFLPYCTLTFAAHTGFILPYNG